MRAIAILLAVLTLAAPAAAGPACDGEGRCRVGLGDRSYHVRLPDGWDGRTPLPVLLHFHGWGRQGDLIVGHRRLAGATRTRGVLLVAPDGLGRSWAFRRTDSRDSAFADAVLADVAARWPTDGTRWVSGYSWGALMAWRYVCDGGRADALMSIAGAFGPGMDCAGRPSEVRHVHGRTDTVLAFPVGPDGDETHAVALWRERMGCGAARTADWQAVSWLTHERHVFDCAAGAVQMDVHDASHLIPRGWLARHLDELQGRADAP